MIVLTQEERFWSKVEKTDTCWLWKASKDSCGYGRFKLNGSAQHAHRVAFELLKGEIPSVKVIDHLCRNPSCVNPTHLEPVTRRENLMRGNFRNSSEYNRRKTHCPHGHEYNEKNTYINIRDERVCKTCVLACNRKYLLKHKELESTQLGLY